MNPTDHNAANGIQHGRENRQNLTEQGIRKIVRDEMDKNYNSGNPRIPPHTHDGNNALNVKEVDLIKNIKYTTEQRYTASITQFFSLVPNPSSISFFGYATDSTTTSAIVNGRAEFGACYQADSDISSLIKPFIQCSNSFTLKPVGVVMQTSTTDLLLVNAPDSTGTTAVSVEVISLDTRGIQLKVTIVAGWTLTGNYIIT